MENRIDSLATLPDSDLSALFAVEVAGWKEASTAACPHKIAVREVFGDDGLRCVVIPHYATSADAVLPWLENWSHCWAVDREPGEDYYVVLGHPELDAFEATASTFARAACIALIKAKRATNRT